MEESAVAKTKTPMNYNVKLVFYYSFFQSFGRGIWMGNVLSMYILLLANYTTLGWTSFTMGIVLTIFVFPTGWLADKYGRDRFLKIASVIGLASLIIVIVGNSIVFIFIALGLWGLFQALSRPSLESILADSVESGKRSKIYSWLHLTRNVAMAIGPFVNIPLFIIFGDNWELSILKNVMIVGIVLTSLSILIMVFFKDKKSLGTASESEEKEEEITEIDEKYKKNGYATKLSQKQRRRLIPYLLVGSNVIVGIGAGMTIKYFPGFFADFYELSPIWVQLIMGTTSVMTGLLSLVAQRMSMKRGRVVIIFIVQLTATLCLFGIAFYPNLGLLIPLFIARGSLMNAAQPLSRSILMDVVPKKNRGKWNSLETLAWGFFWNFSAAIGGYLIGDEAPHNYQLNFFVTAAIYVVGIIPILFLIPLVGKERLAKKTLS